MGKSLGKSLGGQLIPAGIPCEKSPLEGHKLA